MGAAGLIARDAPIDPDRARAQAREILGQRRFRPAARVPKPFEGVLRWLGKRLEPIGRFFRPLGDFLSSPLGWIVVSVVLAGLVALIAWRVAARRARVATADGDPHGHAGEAAGRDPDELERAAARAERDGNLDLAVRLRFRAGLLRLDSAGVVRFRPSLTSGQVARRLRLRTFDDLAIRFDAIAYGGDHASTSDVTSARTGWTRVLAEAR